MKRNPNYFQVHLNIDHQSTLQLCYNTHKIAICCNFFSIFSILSPPENIKNGKSKSTNFRYK